MVPLYAIPQTLAGLLLHLCLFVLQVEVQAEKKVEVKAEKMVEVKAEKPAFQKHIEAMVATKQAEIDARKAAPRMQEVRLRVFEGAGSGVLLHGCCCWVAGRSSSLGLPAATGCLVGICWHAVLLGGQSSLLHCDNLEMTVEECPWVFAMHSGCSPTLASSRLPSFWKVGSWLPACTSSSPACQPMH